MWIRKLFFLVIFIGLFNFQAVFAAENSYEILIKYNQSDSISKLDFNLLPQGIGKIGIKKIIVNSQEEMEAMLNDFKNDPSVQYAEPNGIYSILQVPNDPFHGQDWGLNYTNAEAAWDITTGSSEIIVAVIDTGVDIDHLDLVGNLVSGKNFIEPSLAPQDNNGHGTLVSGIIAAQGNNSYGKAGVVWNTRIMPLKALNHQGNGTIEHIAEAIIYAADNGARVINLSLGGDSPSNVIRDAIRYAHEKGVLVIGAAGNSSSQVVYPAAYREVMAVGAIDNHGNKADFSSYGEEVSLAAPGVNVLGTQLDGEVGINSGTSFAAAYVSGSAALLLSLNPKLTNDQIQWLLESSATDLGTPGWDEEFGYGCLNIYKAVSENINYFKQVEEKKVVRTLYFHLKNYQDTTMKNIALDIMRDFFGEEDDPEQPLGIYRLQGEMGRILSFMPSTYIQELIDLGLGNNVEELEENLSAALVIFLDWTIADRMKLLDYVETNDQDGIDNLLLKYKTLNPYTDENNSRETSQTITDSITGSFGMTNDQDFYKVSVDNDVEMEFIITSLNDVVVELYEAATSELLISSDITFKKTLRGNAEYYLKIYEKNGRWNEQPYSLYITSTPLGAAITGRVLLEGRNNYQGVKLTVEDLGIETETDALGYFIFNNLPSGTLATISIESKNYLKRTLHANVGTGLLDIGEFKMRFGDLNNDEIIDLFDLTRLAKRNDQVFGDSNYEAEFDANQDGIINTLDLQTIIRNYQFKY